MAGPDLSSDDSWGCPALVHATLLDGPWRETLDVLNLGAVRRQSLLVGIDDIDARARYLAMGYGDVTGSQTSLREIEARTLRIAAQVELMPRLRRFGHLQLDLFAREGFVSHRRLGLQPREFALLWRLSDTPLEAVSKKVLIRDVWRMAYVPETNSLAVHVHRLRTKLEPFGLAALVQTTADGGYLFDPDPATRPVGAHRFAGGRFEEDPPYALAAIQGLHKDTRP